MKIISVVILFSLTFFGCTDIIEKSLDNDKVDLIAPGDGLNTVIFNQTFWWNKLTGADRYKLQIVQNRFDSLPQFLLDTTINQTTFSYTLSPGIFQWRVIGLNGSSETKKFQTFTLSIDSSSLSNQFVLLTSPSNNSFVKENNVLLSWQNIFSATNYIVLIESQDTSYTQKTITNNSSIVLLKENIYYWSVKALSSTDSTNFSNKFRFTYDVTAPDTVQTVFPPNNSIEPMPRNFSFRWNASPSTDIDKYKLTVLKDIDKSNVTGFPIETKNLEYSFSTNEINTVFLWKIEPIDKAGNLKLVNQFKRFTTE